MTNFIEQPFTLEDFLDSVPLSSKINLDKLETSYDFNKHLFELYKFVGQAANYTASSIFEQFHDINNQLHWASIIGLLNRCSRLMLSNVCLFANGNFGETCSIIDRCILESSLIVRWLCMNNSDGYFKRYILQGLKTEVAFKKDIENNISKRNNELLIIEKRMLTSIDNMIKKSQTNEEEIIASKKLPNLASMMNDLGLQDFHYTIIQKLGSHHVHGTWPSLLVNYLDETDNTWKPRDANVTETTNQLIFIPLLVLEAINAFIVWTAHQNADYISKQIDFVIEQILIINTKWAGNDHTVVSH